MPGENHLFLWCEDSHPRNTIETLSREHESRFSEIHLSGDLLHHYLINFGWLRKDRKRISRKRLCRKDVDNSIRQQGHGLDPISEPISQLGLRTIFTEAPGAITRRCA